LGHRRHASEQSAFKVIIDNSGMQHLAPLEPKIHPIPTNTTNNPYFNRVSHLQSHHHRSSRNLHSRSYSDYTHPYQTSSPPRTSGTLLAPLHPTYHRRAVSINTMDLILQPLMKRPLDQYNAPPPLYHSSSTSSVTTNAPQSPTNEETGYTSDETNSYHSSTTLSASPKTMTKSIEEKTATHTGNNKYTCPYCDKGFSRPSSLRIHTYSHTGERPFECPESGCSRKFSVQSNMRRHLRVHRLGRPLKRNGGLISPADRAQLINKPLAAKPTSASSNWIGVTVNTAS
jgi:uncharacterized Zn-finger protein